jgi:hypothetical protein
MRAPSIDADKLVSIQANCLDRSAGVIVNVDAFLDFQFRNRHHKLEGGSVVA